MPASTHSTPPSPTDSSVRSKERDLELQTASPADLAATAAAPDPDQPTKEYLTDVHEIPKNNLWLVFTGLILTTALASMDQTIVSTALPTITKELNGSQAEYSWVSAAYMLVASALSPLYGKLSAVFGRKWVLYPSILVFILGSGLCGGAQSMTWLCIARGVQGAGGGGILQLTQIVISDIIPLQDRGKYSGLIGATWGVSAVIAPLIGGALTETIGWQWCFYINLPTGVFALAILAYCLKLNPTNSMSFRQFYSTFDFLGLFLILAGVVLVLLGFNSGETSWADKETIIELVLGVVLLGAAAYVELTTKRSAIIPPRLFRTRTTACILIAVFCQSWGFITMSYYGPLYFQILGSSSIMSGIRMFPFSLGSSVISILSGFYISRYKRYRRVIIVSFFVSALGYALIASLDDRSSVAQQEIYLLIAGIGCGSLFQAPYIALQAAMAISDMPASTSTIGLIRSLGGTMGITASGTMFASLLKRRLPLIAGYTSTSTNLTSDVTGLSQILPLAVRQQVLHAYTRSLNSIWFLGAPLSFIGFVLCCFLKHYALDQREVIRKAKPGETVEDERASEEGVRLEGVHEKEGSKA